MKKFIVFILVAMTFVCSVSISVIAQEDALIIEDYSSYEVYHGAESSNDFTGFEQFEEFDFLNPNEYDNGAASMNTVSNSTGSISLNYNILHSAWQSAPINGDN